MSLCIDTKTAVLDAVNGSLCEVFEMMVGESIVPIDSREVHEPFDKTDPDQEDLSVVVGLSGGLKGSLNICLDQNAAFRWTVQLIDHETTTIDQTVVDAAGELGNMVVGGTKRRLSDHNLTMALPSVIRAGIECLEFPSTVIPVRLDYCYGNCRIAVIVALSQQT